jgi:membrane-anchored glycerophosphoryl diester phosphodiesterase (GDPDase)
VAIPAVVIERTGPIDAIRRSWELTRGNRFTICGAWFALGAVLFGANLMLQLPMMLFGKIVGPLAALALVPLYFLLVSLPILLPAVTYHELRAAKEGVAIEELVKVFE